jgi:uncharacterized protein YjbI with pentapeptide repeats/beta-lactamase regulating signal transducer with metallopeptidase domain
MQSFISALEPAARLTVATLFNSLWEAAVLAFAVWLVLRALPNVNATTRYAAWCLALAGALLLPLATALPQITVQHSAAVMHAPAQAANNAHVSSTTYAAHASAPVPAAPAQSSNATPLTLPQRIHFSLPEYVALALFGIWVLAALALIVRLCVNLWRLERLKRDALPLPVDYRERLSQWSAAEKGGREVRLCICDGIDVPVAVGLFDSMILIPHHLLETLAPDEIDQIMLHELGHLRRADDWTNGVQRVIQALFFFNPAILYIAQQLDLEREVACDDWVLRQTQSVRPYATCLTKMAEVTAWPHRPMAAPGVFLTRRGLSVRVERLLRAGRNIRTSISFGPAGAVIAALVVMFFILQSVAPTFAFTLAQPSQASPASTHQVAGKQKTQTRTVLQDRIVYKEVAVAPKTTATPSPSPRETTIVVPRVHVHIPPRTVKMPGVNVDVPEQHFHFVMPPVAPVHPLPPNFSQQIEQSVNSSMRASMEAVRQSMKATRAAFQNVHGANCVSCDFSGQNLAGHNFRGQELSGTDFSNANLENADFSGAKLAGVDFSHAKLRSANFSHASLTGCDFSKADIAGVNFDGVNMTGCDVDARSLSPSQARALIFACRTGCDFSGANLSGQDLRGVNLTGVDLSNADLRRADLSNSRLNGVDFSGARLDGARFNGAEITGSDLSGVNLSNVDLSGAKLTGDKLRP